jgi:SPP1 gp7 family putative phage head morphogenesis protein
MGYWEDRRAQAQNTLSNKKIAQIEKQMRKYYSDCMNRVIDDFEATYEKIMNQVKEGKEPTPADLYKLDKYWQSQAKLQKELTKLGDKQAELLSKRFEENFFDIYYSFGELGEVSFSNIDKAMVQQMINQVWVADGKSWSQRIWKNTELLAKTLNEELIHCVATGKNPRELKKLLINRFNVSYNNADMLVRTEIAHIQAEACKKRYEDAGISQVEVWAPKRERQCEHCGSLHKTRHSIYEKLPVPAHPNCRCVILPVLD